MVLLYVILIHYGYWLFSGEIVFSILDFFIIYLFGSLNSYLYFKQERNVNNMSRDNKDDVNDKNNDTNNINKINNKCRNNHNSNYNY